MLGTTSKDALERIEMMQFALIKLVEIVGEAANYVSDQTRSTPPEIPGSDVIGMRHRNPLPAGSRLRGHRSQFGARNSCRLSAFAH